MKGPAENIDLSAGRNRLSLLEYVTIVESRFGNDRENRRGGGGWNHSTWCEWCACSATVITITMLKIFLGPFIDDGCCLRMWSSHHILLVECSSQQLNEMLDGWQRRVKKSFLGGGTVELLYEVLNSTASVHTGKTHSQIEPSTLPDCPTLQQALCKHFWSLQHVFSWKSRGYSLRSWRKVVYSVACNYNLATWQLVSGARSIDKQPTRCQIPPFIIYSYYFRWCPWVPPHSFPCWWFIKQFNKA